MWQQVVVFFGQLFSPVGFPPRWLCGQWSAFHGWLSILANLGTFVAYFSIPAVLIFYAWQKRLVIQSELRLLLVLFGSFILACGSTHLIEAVLFWHPIYRFATLVDVFTAVISLLTMVVLIRVTPLILQLRTPKQMEAEIIHRTEALNEARGQLQRSNERFQRMLEDNVVGIIVARFDGVITEANQAFLNMVGYSFQDIQEGTLSWRDITPPGFEAQDTAIIDHLRRVGRSPQFEKQYRHSNGSLVDVLISCTLIEEETVAAFILDISERKANLQALRARQEEIHKLNEALEAKVAERTAALETANAELTLQNEQLEAFSYSVSHDLKAPIRRIHSYAEMMLEDHAPEFSEECQGYLQRIMENTTWMSHLTRDLLALCKTSQAEVHLQQVQLVPVLEELTGTLKRHYGTHYQITLPPMEAAVWADAGLLNIALMNVLENAFKFSQRAETPRVEITLTEDTVGKMALTVADNGCGFDMTYADKVTQPFQRLQPEYDGTGIGLAIVKRVMVAHGGSLHLNSHVNGGTSVTLVFPAEKAP